MTDEPLSDCDHNPDGYAHLERMDGHCALCGRYQPLSNSPRLVVCRDGLAAYAMTDRELTHVHATIDAYDSGHLVPRLLATIYALTEMTDD